MQILSSDLKTPVYATTQSLDSIKNARQYHIELEYTGSTIFTTPNQTCQINCKLFSWDTEITDKLPAGTKYQWLRNGVVFETTSAPTITINGNHIDKNAQIACRIQFDETQL